MDAGLLSGLAEGIKSGMASYGEARDRNLREKEASEEKAFRKRQEALQSANSGLEFDEESGTFKKTAAQLEKENQAAKRSNEDQIFQAAKEGLIGERGPDGLLKFRRDPSLQGPKKEVDPLVRELQLQRLEQGKRQAEEDEMELQVPGYGKAVTKADAKELKDAIVSKDAFDRKAQELIDLRKQYGGEVYNREAVARAKQLSNDLLLEYKNMQKLGVLSQSDKDIVDAIIPQDPLAFSLSSVVGQDPILSKLQKFKEDAGAGFEKGLQTRLRNRSAQTAQNPGPSKEDALAELERRKNSKVAR